MTASNSSISTDKVPCGICRRQFSKYTCPTCNVAYCSLICFRSETHSQCSEAFYRKEIESDIRTQPSKSAEERAKMMELLRRFESAEAEAGDDEEDEESPDDLAQRLANVDLESEDADGIWSALTPEEREVFLKALHDPSSELAQQLLSSEELSSRRQDPWWAPEAVVDEDRIKPQMMRIPSTMLQSPSAHQNPLVYNICSVFIAYAYATRSLAVSPLSGLSQTDPDREESCRIISRLCPFLIERDSKTLFTSVSSVVTDVWSRFETNEIDAPFFALLLRDTGRLFRPQAVTVLATAVPSSEELSDSVNPLLDSHPSRTALLCLSDLWHVFLKPGKTSIDPPRETHVSRKVVFYASHIMSLPPAVVVMVANEVSSLGDKGERDGIDDSAMNGEYHPGGTVIASAPIADIRDGLPKVVIEELS